MFQLTSTALFASMRQPSIIGLDWHANSSEVLRFTITVALSYADHFSTQDNESHSVGAGSLDCFSIRRCLRLPSESIAGESFHIWPHGYEPRHHWRHFGSTAAGLRIP